MANLTVWNKSTMDHKESVQALDRSLQDINNYNRIIGEITILR